MKTGASGAIAERFGVFCQQTNIMKRANHRFALRRVLRYLKTKQRSPGYNPAERRIQQNLARFWLRLTQQN